MNTNTGIKPKTNTNALAVESSDLLALGYTWDSESEAWWSPSSCSSGAALTEGMWTPCSMFDSGEIQYGDFEFHTAGEAAKEAISLFS